MSFPKMGNVFPGGDKEPRYATIIGAALRQDLGGTHRAIKTIVKWTGASERTAKNWLAGACGPSGAHLVALLRKSDGVLEAVLLLAGRESVVASRKLVEARDTLREVLAVLQTVTE